MKRENLQLNTDALHPVVLPLLRWYDSCARELPWRSELSPYRVWVSEIMLQQTRVEAVKPYFKRFMQALPDISALAAAPEAFLMKLWEGLGYYSRARNLQKAAQLLAQQGKNTLPADFGQLLALPGIGRYTAGAVGSIAFGLPVAAVDGNVLRVVMRLLNCTANISLPPVRLAVERALFDVIPAGRPGDFNQALMELGATVCLPNGAPDCTACPVSAHCGALREGTALSLPVKAEKKKRRMEEKTVFFLLSRETADTPWRLALRRREETGLLAGLWEPPNLPGRHTEEALPALLAVWNILPGALLEKRTAKHIFTHVEWHMDNYLLLVDGKEESPFVWADADTLTKEYAVPSAFSAGMEAVRERMNFNE